MIKFILIIVFFVLLVIKIYFSQKKILPLKYLFTPVTTFILVLISLLSIYYFQTQYSLLICVGLILSLIGDIFNMIEPPEYKFIQIAGVYFVFTQLLYITAFLKDYIFQYFHLFSIILILIILFVLYKLILKKISSLKEKINIFIYILVVTVSLFSAVYNLTVKINLKSILISAGMILFWGSDFILGIHVFVKKVKLEPLLVWGFYGSAQLLIALSCYY
ncbi:MAG: lysoplasmalogenase [Spirochaetes bacterium]|nr:lysoplasmalogenase [Spirochaetota bacterium]